MQRRQLLQGSLVAAPLLALAGCKGLSGLLPVIGKIIGGISDASAILDAVDKVAGEWLAHSSDEELRIRYARVMASCRGSLNAVLKLAEGVEAVSNEDIEEAFLLFKQAYVTLVALLQQAGFGLMFRNQTTPYSSPKSDMPTVLLANPDELRLDLP